jgi:phage tail-like protein
MNLANLRRYRFSTEAQWQTCLAAKGDRQLLRQNRGFSPFAPYERNPKLYKSTGAYGPTITPNRVILWRDAKGCLQRLSPYCPCAKGNERQAPEFAYDTEPEILSSPSAIALATRVVSTVRDLWVVGDVPNSLNRYEHETLAQLGVVELPKLCITDIASGDHETIFALVQQEEAERAWQVVQFDCSGHTLGTVTLKGLSEALAFVFLRRSHQFVVLTEEKLTNKDTIQRLRWFNADDGKVRFSLVLGALRRCFHVTENHSQEKHLCNSAPRRQPLLCSDLHDRIFLAGADGKDFCGGAYVVVLDKDGNLLDQIPIASDDTPVTGIAAGSDNLVVTGTRGLLQFRPSETVPDAAGDVSCTLITPMLHSPERPDARGWLRAEVLANLPEGATLEISVAATSDAAVRDRMNAIADDASLPESHRMRRLLNQPDVWRAPKTLFHGVEPQTNDTATTYSAPLFDIREPYAWISLTLAAAPRANLPAIVQMAVLYPNLSLIDDLPAIYRRSEGQPSFVRSLVGVLEVTTQELDARIGSMGSLVNPSTAPLEWLDFVARWLGLPWDNALSPEQKRSIVLHASELTQQRGTRAGLETLLDCLVPGTPRRFRIADTTADFGFTMVGDAACPGSQLPAMLGGFTRWNAALDERAILGYMHLPCPNQTQDPARWWAGKIRVEIAASAEERKAWEPWLYRLISELVPLTARVRLDWVSAYALRSDVLDDMLILEPAPVAHLGTDAITDVARLPEGVTRISSSGRTIGTRLH